MTTPRHLIGLPIFAALLSISPRIAEAQPRRAAPALTTPPPATPAAPAAPAAAEDPMGGVKGVAVREIASKPKPDAYAVNFNLDDADLPDLVKAISNITGKRFIYGSKLRAIKATVFSPEKISAGEAYQAFLSILDTNGMTVIPHGRFFEIVESAGVAGRRTEIYSTSSPVPDEDRYVTRLHRLSHLDVNDAATVLAKFKSKDGDITVHAPGNLLILTETGANIRRMLRILEEIDAGGAGEQIWVEPIHYVNPTELAGKLGEILDLKGSKGAPGAAPGAAAPAAAALRSGMRLVADDRGSALVIIATEADYLRLLELIKRFDVKLSGDGEIRVVMLQHAACKDLSQTLNQILGVGALGAGAGARPSGAAPGATAGRTPGAAGSGTGGDDVFEGRVRLTCDEPTNSIVTTSSARDYAQLHAMIQKLDRPRRQVFIEATIMDVTVDRSSALGISYHAGSTVGMGSAGNGVVYGGNNIMSSISGVPSNLEGLALGIRGPDIPSSQNIFGTGLSIPALGAVLSAMAKDGDVNVLATPHIIATDNIKAEISIGQNIPLQTNVSTIGTLAGLAGASGAAGASALNALGGGQNSGRQDVGTKITVIPHINDSDQVRLELSEEISEAGDALGTLGAVPINKRTANTTLVVKDQQTVVIGGLVRDLATTSETKIPILGDIPVLGFLFKQTSKTKQKSNLLLILTPYIIRDQDDLRAIFERKMQERQEIIDRYFVFSDAAWTPPKDYRRTNGLLEEIRQATLDVAEKQRIEAESKPRAPKTHEPTKPIPRPASP
jgi:general secretion pathway protein D